MTEGKWRIIDIQSLTRSLAAGAWTELLGPELADPELQPLPLPLPRVTHGEAWQAKETLGWGPLDTCSQCLTGWALKGPQGDQHRAVYWAEGRRPQSVGGEEASRAECSGRNEKEMEAGMEWDTRHMGPLEIPPPEEHQIRVPPAPTAPTCCVVWDVACAVSGPGFLACGLDDLQRLHAGSSHPGDRQLTGYTSGNAVITTGNFFYSQVFQFRP